MSPGAPGSRTLVGLVTGVRRYLTRRAGTLVGSAAAAVVGATLVAAFWLAGPSGWRSGTAMPLVLVLLGTAVLLGVAAWVGTRHRRWSAEPRIAEEMERAAHLPEGTVRGQVELARAVPGGVSGSLAAAGEARVLSRLSAALPELAGRPGEAIGRWLRVGLGASAIAVVAVGALLVANPNRARAAWGGLVRPVALLTPDPLPAMEVSPGDAELPRGEAPLIEIGAVGRDSVAVHWQAIGDLPEERMIVLADGRAETLLPPLDTDFRYWVSDMFGGESARYTLRPADPALLANLRIEVTYPAYTRLPRERFQAPPAWLQLPEGSSIEISGQLRGIGAAVRLVDDDGEIALRLPVTDDGFAGEWRPTRSGVVTWALEEGADGALLPDPMELELVEDQAPALSLPVPGGDIEMPVARRVPLVIEAVDDYGIAWIEVDTRLVREGREGEPVRDRIPTNGLPQVALRPVLDFSAWGLRPGDDILLRVRAADNAPSAHVVESAVYRLAVPDEAALRSGARETIDRTRERSQELLDRLAREAREQRDLERRTQFGSSGSSGSPNDPQPFEDREELLQMLDRQAEVADALEALRSELSEVRQAIEEMAMARRSQSDAELAEQLQRIEEMMEQVMTPEERARLDEMRESLRDGEMPRPPEELIQDMAERQAELQERLDRALEELRRAELDQSLREVEDEVSALLEEQRDVSDQLNESAGRERQEQIAERTEQARENLDELGSRMDESGDTDAQEERETAARELDDAADSMREAAQAGERGEREESEERAEAAADALSEALSQMQAARQEMQQTEEERRDDALRQAAQNALSLARRQAELRLAFGPGPIIRLDYANEELALREGLTTLERSIQEAVGGGDPAVAGPLGAEMSRAMSAADNVVRGLRGGSGPQPDPRIFADSTQASLNRVAVMALNAMGESPPPEQSASGDQSSESLSQLGEQQQELNAQSQQRAQESGASGTPSPAELEDLVAGQQGIAAALQEMANQRGPGFTGSQLDALADESAQIAEEIGGGRLDGPVLERQDRFLQRLLDAGRTLEQDGPTDEREGTTAEETPRRAVTALPDAILDPAAFALPSAEQLDALSPGLRSLVLDYFERVNRRRATEDVRP